ncbi:MAG TPA: pitrilysin family protein [Candidatus Acidoferrales bacterium]|nr:pitrilysin family protein [Candidatus Acidoferrales bacterium]
MATGVKRFRHKGLRVLHQHVDAPLTAIALSIRAGARFDGRFPGIAHMAEHMLFQGTTSLDQVALNRRAAELGGEHNADTGYETISLTFEVFNEDVPDALGLLADQFYNSQVSEERFRKERRVVIDEARGRMDDPIDRLHARAWGRFFRGPLANPVWGNMRSLREMQARNVTAFIKNNFKNVRAVLAVVGGVREGAVQAAVRRHFRHGQTNAVMRGSRVAFGEPGTLRLRGDGGQAHMLHMVRIPPTPRSLIAVGMALDLVGADPDSRLFQEIRERLGLGYEVSASLDWGSGWAVATLSASAARGVVDRLQRAVLETCDEAAKGGFSDEEMQRARKKLRYRYASLADSRFERALALAEGMLSGFPTPEEAEKIVTRMERREVENAWRTVLRGQRLTAILA